MGSPRRRNSPGLTQQLEERSYRFDFFQAVRLLQRASPERALVGHFNHPGDEVARFGANADLAFPAGEIQELELPPGARPGKMTVNFLGLVGHMAWPDHDQFNARVVCGFGLDRGFPILGPLVKLLSILVQTGGPDNNDHLPVLCKGIA